MHFVFYDLETSGISTTFDQPLQFAAIRTDEKLKEIDRVDIRCQLAPHILPSPQALAVTGMHPDMLADPKLPSSLEFAQKLFDLVGKWGPAFWIGYNSIRFDEEMLRQTFYQNLLRDIYATQFNGNRRADVMFAVYAVRARHNDLMKWPEDIKGHQNFRLDSLAPANGFKAHKAHDALGDTEATLYLARQIAKKAPELWREFLGNSLKATVEKKLDNFRPVDLVARIRGGMPASITGCLCGHSETNSARAAFLNLDACDPKELLDLDEKELIVRMKKQPELIVAVATNKAPPLFDAPQASDEHLRRAEIVAQSPGFRKKAGRAIEGQYAQRPQSADNPVERQIHGQFYSPADKKLLEKFRAGDWPERVQILERLGDARLRQLGLRLVAFYSPDLLSKGDRTRYAKYLEKKWGANDQEVEWTTAQGARDQIGEMRDEGKVDAGWLDAVSKFIEGRLAEPSA